MSKPKPKPREKAKTSSPSHGAGSVGWLAEAGAVVSTGEASSGVSSEQVPEPQVNEWFSKHRWGIHKNKSNWRDVLKKAKAEWKQPEQDVLIAAPHTEKYGSCPSEEIKAAVQWECFRHLYFSEQLSDFWKEMIEGNQIDALEKHHPNSIRKISVICSHDPNDFASPWATWANTLQFPMCPWIAARKCKKFAAILAAAEVPSDCATLLTDYINTWAIAEHWAQQQIEEFHQLSATNPQLARDTYVPKINEPAEIPCTGEKPERAGSENITRVILEIDWDSPKTAIFRAFERQIEPLWKKRNPNAKNGRGDTERTFFSGLAIRRRIVLGKTAHDACEGLYTPRADTKEGLPHSAQNALDLADKRLAETKAALDAIEDKLRQN
jgi:hypothetical protein